MIGDQYPSDTGKQKAPIQECLQRQQSIFLHSGAIG